MSAATKNSAHGNDGPSVIDTGMFVSESVISLNNYKYGKRAAC